MAIRKSVGVSVVLERATERLAAKPQLGGVSIVSGARKVAQMLDALETIAERRNPTETPEAHALRVNAAARKLLKAVEQQAEVDNATRAEAARSIQSRLDLATGLVDPPRGREIRDVLRTMDATERAELIDRAIKARDVETVGAALCAPAFLAGIAPDRQAAWRTAYEAEVAPAVLAEFDELLAADEAAATVRRVAREFAQEAEKPDYVRRIEADRAQAERAQSDFDTAAG
jgi:hypothetical protein